MDARISTQEMERMMEHVHNISWLYATSMRMAQGITERGSKDERDFAVAWADSGEAESPFAESKAELAAFVERRRRIVAEWNGGADFGDYENLLELEQKMIRQHDRGLTVDYEIVSRIVEAHVMEGMVTK
jgi:hypothetical protein